MSDSTFEGSIRVRSTGVGYAVTFECKTDAHDLGHAIAAIITHYLDCALKTGAGEPDELRQLVLEGIRCGTEHNPSPLRRH